jgi:hypothetical protein
MSVDETGLTGVYLDLPTAMYEISACSTRFVFLSTPLYLQRSPDTRGYVTEEYP